MSYSKIDVKGNTFTRTRVEETLELELPIQKVQGVATLTHIGWNCRLRFVFKGVEYATQNQDVAVSLDESSAIFIKDIIFDRDIDESWQRVVRHEEYAVQYWTAV